MKSYVFSAMMASLAVAGAQETAQTWSYALPETGLLPSAISCDLMTSMRERHGGESHFAMQEVNVTIPFSDPYVSSVRGWAVNVALNSSLSFVDAEGTLNLESDTLYKFSLPVSLIRKTAGGNRIILAAAPTLASDFERAARSFDLGLFAAYTRTVNDNFNYSLGLAVYPNFTMYGLVPIFGFEWKPVEDWTFQLKGYRLSAMKALTERFSAGAFMGAEGGVWAVETQRGSRMLSVRSFVLGLTGEYDFSAPGQRKRIVTASLGSTVASSVRFHEWNSDRDADEAHHYRPGLYASFGVDFRF